MTDRPCTYVRTAHPARTQPPEYSGDHANSVTDSTVRPVRTAGFVSREVARCIRRHLYAVTAYVRTYVLDPVRTQQSSCMHAFTSRTAGRPLCHGDSPWPRFYWTPVSPASPSSRTAAAARTLSGTVILRCAPRFCVSCMTPPPAWTSVQLYSSTACLCTDPRADQALNPASP
eukprot:COSAG01_NODE_120_length_25409_cov_20.648572_14_plen_173_part_00